MSKKLFALLLAAAIFAGFAVITDGLVAGISSCRFAPVNPYCDPPYNCCLWVCVCIGDTCSWQCGPICQC